MSLEPRVIGSKDVPVPAVRWRSWHPFDQVLTADEIREFVDRLTFALEEAEKAIPRPPKPASWWRRWRERGLS
jgi:hypothetical protein